MPNVHHYLQALYDYPETTELRRVCFTAVGTEVALNMICMYLIFIHANVCDPFRLTALTLHRRKLSSVAAK